ncbi:MAG: hypothetical protein JSW58_13240 [Candidatus Latescibacterota bacterium]|nr:MAG: hypothetical protein JSW58_13240 [Candidatus Latescibacterota bacterium]
MKSKALIPLLVSFALGALVPVTGSVVDSEPSPVPHTAAAQTAPAPPCANVAVALKTKLENVFAVQEPGGSIRFQPGDSILFHHPLLATLSLRVYEQTGDVAFLTRAHEAITYYFNHLLVYYDVDGDFLIERSAYRYLSSAPAGAIEDVGFNAIFALDMLSLSRICLILKMPVDGLFWYQGMKTVSHQLVASTYDNDAHFFLPANNNAKKREGVFLALSALPTYFRNSLGDNFSTSVLRNYVLTNQDVVPEVPFHYLNWGFSSTELWEAGEAERILRSMLLIGALEWNGLETEAAHHADVIRTRLDADSSISQEPSTADVYTRFFRCALGGSDTLSPFPRYHELDLLETLVFQKSLLNGPETSALRAAAAGVKRFLLSHGSNSSPPPMTLEDSNGIDAISRSVRGVYWAISSLREKWRTRTLFDPRDRDKIPGFDTYEAVSGLWEDVIETLHEAENLIGRTATAKSGFDINATLLKEATVPGASVTVKLALSTLLESETVSSVVLFRAHAIDTLLKSSPPLPIDPGAPPIELSHSCPMPRDQITGILPFSFSVEAQFADRRRVRRHFRRGVFMTKPVTFAVAFPNGNTMASGSVPIEIQVEKHVAAASVIHAEWYSPAGLRPIEGAALETWMPANADRTDILMNIPVPTPCRPGAFPFTLKVFANGVDAGTVTSSFFRHYQWLFVGPFAERLNALDERYPPETRINVLETYTGVGKQIRWQPLSPEAYADHGRIDLGSLLPDGSVGFLYTVVKASATRATTLLFRSDTPAILYVNGDEVVRVRDASSYTERVEVLLHEGMNSVLVKTLSHGAPSLFFQLGEKEDLTSDEFNNNLWELVDGYEMFHKRGTESTGQPREIQRPVTLTYNDPDANSVAVIGNFNGWSAANSNLRKNEFGEWEISLILKPGRYVYRFLVNNRSEVLDPSSPQQEPDGYGGWNSVLFVR